MESSLTEPGLLALRQVRLGLLSPSAEPLAQVGLDLAGAAEAGGPLPEESRLSSREGHASP